MSQLREAVDALVAVATEAGLPPGRARDEAMVFAAAIAEAAPRAALDWCAALDGGPTELGAANAAFFDAASRGRKSRGAPTALLSELTATHSGHAAAYAKALTEVASAACSLGEPTLRVTGNAAVAAAAQLGAARAAAPRVPAPDLLTGRPQPRGPIARATLTALTTAAPNSQRAYERRAGVSRRSAVAIGPLAAAVDEKEVAWRRGRALFHLRDSQGRHGRPGAVYLAWQLPNEYTGPHAALPRGRQKRLNRALADLFHDGMTGNGERPVGSGQYSVVSKQLAVSGRPPRPLREGLLSPRPLGEG